MFPLTFNELENFGRVEIFTFFDFRRIETLPFKEDSLNKSRIFDQHKYKIVSFLLFLQEAP